MEVIFSAQQLRAVDCVKCGALPLEICRSVDDAPWVTSHSARRLTLLGMSVKKRRELFDFRGIR